MKATKVLMNSFGRNLCDDDSHILMDEICPGEKQFIEDILNVTKHTDIPPSEMEFARVSIRSTSCPPAGLAYLSKDISRLFAYAQMVGEKVFFYLHKVKANMNRLSIKELNINLRDHDKCQAFRKIYGVQPRLYAYHASEIMKAIRKLVHGYNVIEDAFRRTTSKDNKVRLLTIRRLKYILSHLYTVLMEIEMVGKVRDPALQGIPSMEGITNKSVLSTLKIAPTPWEAFWRSGRKRYYDIYAEDLKGPSRTTLLEERRARSREYSKKKYEYIVESKKGAEIYKKEVEYNGRTGVCRICSKKNIPIKKLEEHNKNCKKIEDIKEELLKLNELLMIECKKAGEMKENTYKLTSKPNAPSKKKTEVKHQEADKKDKLDKQDTTMTTAKSGNTFANSIAPSFVSDRKLIVDKKFENKATVDSSQIKRANSGERIEDLTAQNDATIKSVNSAFVPSNLKDTRREEPRSEPLRFIHTKLDVHDNDNQPSTIQEEHIDASHQDNPNEIKNLNSQVKFAEHSNDNLHDIHSPEHTHKSAPAGANVSNDDHSNHFTQSGNDFSEDSSEEERENKKNFKPSRFCNYNTSKQKKDAKNNYSQLPLSPVQDQSNDDTDKFQKAVMDSSPGTANMSKSRISQAADSPLQFKKEEPRKSIEIKPVPTASTHQENKKPQEPQDDEKPTIGDMFDPSEDSSKSEQSSGGSDNRDKTTVPKRSGFLLEKIDREQKEKAAEQRRLQEEQEEALRKKAYEEAAKKSMMEEEKKEVRCEADKPIFKNKLAEQPKTPELAPAIVPATRVEGNNSSKKEKKKNEEVFVGDMLLDDDDDEDDDEEDDADSDSSHVDEELITAPKNNGLKKSNFGTMITQPIVKNQSNEKDKQKENLQEAPNFIAGLMEDSDNDADQDKKSDKSKSKLNSSRSQVKTPTSVDNPPSIPQREREISEPIFSFGKGASIINKRGNDSDGSADKNADSVPNSGGSTLKILDLVQFGRKSPHPDTRSQPVKPDSDQASKMSGDSKQPDPVQVNLSQKEQLKKFRSVARQPQFETQILEKEEKIKPKPKHHEEEEVSAHPVTAQKDNEFLMVKIAKDLFGEIAQYGEAIKRHPFGDQSLNRETSLINMLKQIINNDEFYFDDVKQFSKGILAKVDRRFHLIREINKIEVEDSKHLKESATIKKMSVDSFKMPKKSNLNSLTGVGSSSIQILGMLGGKTKLSLGLDKGGLRHTISSTEASTTEPKVGSPDPTPRTEAAPPVAAENTPKRSWVEAMRERNKTGVVGKNSRGSVWKS